MVKSAAVTDYGNWVSKRLIFLPGFLALIFIALSLFSLWFAIPAALCVIAFTYFSYAYNKFSPAGGDVQAKIRALVLDNLKWNGEGQALDIGCGNGAMVVAMAKKYPRARITGTDYWGGNWGYSETVCLRNVEAEKVAKRTDFKRGSAEKLPFADAEFDAVVSNLVFHEVGTVADKRQLVKEAIRVLKKGGFFAFQDLFQVERFYGDMDTFIVELRDMGISAVEFKNTASEPFIPGPLKLPFMVGTIGILSSTK